MQSPSKVFRNQNETESAFLMNLDVKYSQVKFTWINYVT